MDGIPPPPLKTYFLKALHLQAAPKFIKNAENESLTVTSGLTALCHITQMQGHRRYFVGIGVILL